LRGVVFDIFGASRGGPARRPRPEGGVNFFSLLLKSWVLVWEDRKFLIFQRGLTDTLSASMPEAACSPGELARNERRSVPQTGRDLHCVVWHALNIFKKTCAAIPDRKRCGGSVELRLLVCRCASYETGMQMDIDTFTLLSLRSTLKTALAVGTTRS
jgi:hypothetical protein